MKILIAYYSKTGATEKLAQLIEKELRGKNHLVEVEKIKVKKERSVREWYFIWFSSFLLALVGKKLKCEIEKPKIKDLSNYDIVCIGTPHWGGLSLPVASYLEEIEGLKNKRVGFFATTAFPPLFEWLFFSGFYLDFIFFRIIEGKKGKPASSILFASGILSEKIQLKSIEKRWGMETERGKRKIKDFCKEITFPIYSLKDYLLKQKELRDARFFAVLFPIFLVLFLFFQIIFFIFDWDRFFLLFTILVLGYLGTAISKFRREVLFIKYFTALTLTIFLVLTVLFLGFPPEIFLFGHLAIILALIFFLDQKVIIFSSFILMFFLSYFYLILEITFPVRLYVGVIFLYTGILSLIARSLREYFIELLETQGELEAAGELLEIKVRARTRELKELTENLDEQVREKTRELQKKLEELEKFHRLTIGRELKMIELKEEIKKLKGGPEKAKGQG